MSHEIPAASQAVEDDAWVDDVDQKLSDMRDMLDNALVAIKHTREIAEENRTLLQQLVQRKKRRWWGR